MLPTTWELITAYGGILLAVAGTTCLIMVVVTSIKAARRRLRYESWHLLHLYGYLGVGLALPHQLWTGQEFLQSPAATVYWWTLWGVAAAAVLVWRICAAAVAQRALSAPGRRGGSGVLRCRVRLPHRAAIGPAAGAGRAVHQRPVPQPAGMDTCQPVLAVDGSQRATRSESPRRPSATAAHGWRTCARAPGCCSRARTGG